MCCESTEIAKTAILSPLRPSFHRIGVPTVISATFYPLTNVPTALTITHRCSVNDYSLSHSRAPDTACPQIKLARVLVLILSLAVRRKGIARFAALHLIPVTRVVHGRVGKEQ
jgi:hypothetical protein